MCTGFATVLPPSWPFEVVEVCDRLVSVRDFPSRTTVGKNSIKPCALVHVARFECARRHDPTVARDVVGGGCRDLVEVRHGWVGRLCARVSQVARQLVKNSKKP